MFAPKIPEMASKVHWKPQTLTSGDTNDDETALCCDANGQGNPRLISAFLIGSQNKTSSQWAARERCDTTGWRWRCGGGGEPSVTLASVLCLLSKITRRMSEWETKAGHRSKNLFHLQVNLESESRRVSSIADRLLCLQAERNIQPINVAGSRLWGVESTPVALQSHCLLL